MTAPDVDLLAAKRRETAYLHSLVTAQAQRIDELLDQRSFLLAALQAGFVPGLTTAKDLTTGGGL